ncbi:hypothetical protein F0562_028017 [Nyssa sinensis]|uniref:Peptidase A1 domain-containing protein n=1 Tax=Nyssa sinensis TaxID=561372 RepID=A0A5J5B9J8_9ASTE|nr:hypothetical protein F0562_028017 [Nyssa sinensis]
MMMLLFLVILSTTFLGGSAANQPQSKSTATNRFGTVVFPVTGNVYPGGYYHVTLNIGHPPKPYFLDIDTGSDLTWLQCDAPCTKCTPAPHTLYKPRKNLVTCKDPMCAAFHSPAKPQCQTPMSNVTTRLAFGCGYNQELPDSIRPPYTDGILGLGNGKSSIVSQLHDLGLIQNVVGHCLSGKGGGFLFFGDDLIPSSGIVWTPMIHNSVEKHHSSGPAELLYGGQAIATLSTVKKDLNRKQLKDANEDRSLPVCWKGTKPFKSIHDVKNYFKTIVLNFMNAKNIQLQLPPEAYLVVTDNGTVCLGILNGGDIGLGNFNIIGDISLQDKMVIYDNEKQQIGWFPANCDRLPKS